MAELADDWMGTVALFAKAQSHADGKVPPKRPTTFIWEPISLGRVDEVERVVDDRLGMRVRPRDPPPMKAVPPPIEAVPRHAGRTRDLQASRHRFWDRKATARIFQKIGQRQG